MAVLDILKSICRKPDEGSDIEGLWPVEPGNGS